MSIALAVAGAGALLSYAAQRDAANSAMAAAENNAKLLQYEADYQKEKGDIEALDIMRKGHQIQGAQKTAYAAGNIDVNSGSALDVLKNTAYGTSYDSQATLYDAEVKSVVNQNKVDQELYEGQANEYANNLKSYGSLLTGVGKLGESFVGLDSEPKK